MIFSDLPSPAEASSRRENLAKGFAQAGNRHPLFGIMLYSLTRWSAIRMRDSAGAAMAPPACTRSGCTGWVRPTCVTALWSSFLSCLRTAFFIGAGGACAAAAVAALAAGSTGLVCFAAIACCVSAAFGCLAAAATVIFLSAGAICLLVFAAVCCFASASFAGFTVALAAVFLSIGLADLVFFVWAVCVDSDSL